MSKGSASANLPLARVRTIMKSSPEVETVSQESLYLITRATVSIKTFRLRHVIRTFMLNINEMSSLFVGTFHNVLEQTWTTER